MCRCLEKTHFLGVVNLELREAMELSVVPELPVARPPSHQLLLPPPSLKRKSSFSIGENKARTWKEKECVREGEREERTLADKMISPALEMNHDRSFTFF